MEHWDAFLLLPHKGGVADYHMGASGFLDYS